MPEHCLWFRWVTSIGYKSLSTETNNGKLGLSMASSTIPGARPSAVEGAPTHPSVVDQFKELYIY